MGQLFESEEVITFFKRMNGYKGKLLLLVITIFYSVYPCNIKLLILQAIEESKRQLLAVRKLLFDTEVQLTVEDHKIYMHHLR